MDIHEAAGVVPGMLIDRIYRSQVPPRRPEDDRQGLEVHVAAGQVWLVIPEHTDCCAIYPDSARVLATAVEQVATRGGDKRIFLTEDTSLLIARNNDAVVIVRDTAQHDPEGLAVAPSVAYGFARRIRDAADRAERGTRALHAA